MDKIDLRYQRGKIYTIRCYDDDSLIYVGSTIQPLCVRIAEHRRDKLCSLYQYVNNNFNGDWKKWYIELYEEYPCNNKELLVKKEGEITRLIGSINKRIEGRTRKEYYEANKEIINKKKKEYSSKKVICDHCGCELRKDSLNKHQKTNKCKNYNITKE